MLRILSLMGADNIQNGVWNGSQRREDGQEGVLKAFEARLYGWDQKHQVRFVFVW
jgi:hypothetical protein